MRLHRSLTSHRKVPFRPVLTFVYPSKPTVGALLLPFSDSLRRVILGNQAYATLRHRGGERRGTPRYSLEHVMNFEQTLGLRLRKEVAVWEGFGNRWALLRAGSGLFWLDRKSVV